MKTYILAALTCAIASAHVRMRYTEANIRNAGAANADGKFSVRGPCGGADKFAANGITSVEEGSEMTLTIAYNGGHKSQTKNFFSVAYLCGKTDVFPNVFDGTAQKGNAKLSKAFEDAKGVLLAKDKIVSPQQYPVDATDSKISGYDITFKVPVLPQDATDDGRKCTISLVEYRNWGGCVDLLVTARDPNAPTPPPPPPPSLTNPTALSLAQIYDISDIDYNLRQNRNMCVAGDCSCKSAIKDKKCLWQKNKGENGPCMTCQYKEGKEYKDNCLCDVTGSIPYVRHYGSCTYDSPNCLCLDGRITVWHQTSKGSGSADINVRAMSPDHPDKMWFISQMVPMQEGGRALATDAVTIVVQSGGESYEQKVMLKSTPADPTTEGDKRVHLSLTVVDDSPKLCSFEATLVQDPEEVQRQDIRGTPRPRSPSQDRQIVAQDSALTSSLTPLVVVLVITLLQ